MNNIQVSESKSDGPRPKFIFVIAKYLPAALDQFQIAQKF